MAHLVFVCHGNICRSPMAERVARRMLAERGIDATVESYGLSAEESGNPIDRRAVRVLRERGYDADNHTARRIQPRDMDGVDLVIGVEPYHVRQLQALAPDAKVALLNDFNSELDPDTSLIDPWYGDQEGFYDTLADIEAAMPAIINELLGEA